MVKKQLTKVQIQRQLTQLAKALESPWFTKEQREKKYKEYEDLCKLKKELYGL